MPRIKKEEMTDHENKKQMVSMLNVFSSPDSASKERPAKPEEEEQAGEAAVVAEASDEKLKAEKPKEKNDIMALLSSDISGLSIQEADPATAKSPYADLSEALSSEKQEEKQSDELPTGQTKEPQVDNNMRQKHYELVKRLSEALDYMARERQTAKATIDRTPAAVSGTA